MQSKDDIYSKTQEENTEEKTVTEEKLILPDRDCFGNLIKFICEDNAQQFCCVYRSIENSTASCFPKKREIDAERPEDICQAVNYLHLACKLDSVACAKCILEGDLGFFVPVNSPDEYGKTALHHAAYAHSIQCIELLLKKQCRTDVKSKDGHLPLDLALSSKRMQVNWSIADSVIDLLHKLRDKDMNAVKMLVVSTKDVPDIAYRKAIGGEVVALAILLTVSSDRIISAFVTNHEESSLSETVFDHIIRKVLSQRKPDNKDERTHATKEWITESDKHLLDALELLLHFGANAIAKTADTRPLNVPLITASQAGDALVVKMLLDQNFHPDETDRDGNTALHWCLRVTCNTQDTRIMSLLLMHGASTSIRNTLGFAPLHTAASHGHLQGLKILLFREPANVDIVTETQETALFYAAKNSHVECARLLLRHGANRQALNLRKQRPFDVARSQEMRDLLNSPSPKLETDYPLKQLHQKSNQVQDQCAEGLAMYKKTEICRYYESSGGCLRGDKCYYAHGVGELRRLKNAFSDGKYTTHVQDDLNRKVFIGGLSPTVDSEDLKAFFESNFGSVVDAIVIGSQIGEQIQSRGFGFVTFKDEDSVVAAVKTHYVTIFGKKVEIKGAVPRSILTGTETSKGTILQERTGTQRNKDHEEEDFKGVEGNQNSTKILPESNQNPPWVEKFKKWLPEFLGEVSKRLKEGEWYPLSSLKGDFRATCGMELDHVSLGYLKLSDFIRSMPGLCRMKIVPVGVGPATHMVLQALPARSHSQDQPTVTLGKSTLVEKGVAFSTATRLKGPEGSIAASFERKRSLIPVNMSETTYYANRQDSSISTDQFTASQHDVRYLTDLLSAFDASPMIESEHKSPILDEHTNSTNSKDKSIVTDVHSHTEPSLCTPRPHDFLSFLRRDTSFFTPWANQGPEYSTERQALKELQNTCENSPQSVLSPLGPQPCLSETSLESRSPADSSDSVKSDFPYCGRCMTGKAIWIAMPCAHRILCTSCRNIRKTSQLPLTCFICGKRVNKLLALY